MKWNLGRAVLTGSLFLPVLGACSSSPIDDEQSAGLTSAEVESVRAAVSTSLGNGLATAYSVAVWRDGQVVFAEAFGERASGIPATTSTQFQIGSDTKKITALALLQEVDKQRLSLGESVKQRLPELELAHAPRFLDTVTIRDLLRHTTGLYDYTPWLPAAEDSALEKVTLERFAQNEYALMPAGIAYNYANPNYSLAGLIVEKLENQPWADIVTENVFRPLGLTHTHARLSRLLAREQDVATGFGYRTLDDRFDALALADAPQPELGAIPPEEQVDNAFLRPAGLVWSTPTDQVKLLAFFIDGKPQLVSDALREAMMAVQAPLFNHVTGNGYGYGLVHEDFYRTVDDTHYPTPFVWHDGGTLSMTSLSLMLPEQRVAVSVLANGRGEDLRHVADAALLAAAGTRLPDPVEPPNLLGPPSSDLESYAGTYSDPTLGDLALRWLDGALHLESPLLLESGLAVGPLTPVGNDLFSITIDSQPLFLSFYDGEDGTPHKYGVNRSFVLTRK